MAVLVIPIVPDQIDKANTHLDIQKGPGRSRGQSAVYPVAPLFEANGDALGEVSASRPTSVPLDAPDGTREATGTVAKTTGSRHHTLVATPVALRPTEGGTGVGTHTHSTGRTCLTTAASTS